MSKLLDRLGREIEEKALIYWIGKQDVIWQIRAITPLLNPQAPAGAIEIQVIASIVVGVPGNTPITDLLLVAGPPVPTEGSGTSGGDDGGRMPAPGGLRGITGGKES